MYGNLFIIFMFFFSSAFASQDIHMSCQSPKKVPTDTSFITFTFSQNIIKRDAVGTFSHEHLLLCSDDLTGAYEFVSQNQIRLYPNRTLHASTHYSCKPNPNKFTEKSDGQDATFQTEAFARKEIRYFKEGIARLVFNDLVDDKMLEKNLFIYKKNNLAKTRLRYTLTADENHKVFLVKIVEPIQDSPIQIILKQTLSSQNHKPLDKTYNDTFKEKSIPFKLDTKRKAMPLYDDPHYIALGDGRLGIRLYFPGYFYRDENPIKSYIHINGINSFSLTDVKYIDFNDRKKRHLHDKSETYVDIIADFKPQHTYGISLLKGLKDSYQFQLREDHHFSVKIGDRQSALHFEQKDKPYLSSKGEIGFESVNLDHVMMIIEKIPTYNYRYFINFQKGDPKKVAKAAVQVYSKQLILSNRKNQFVKHRFSLKQFTSQYKSGIFRIVMRFGKRSVYKVIYLSDIAISAKISKDQAFISLATLSSGKAIKDAQITLFSDKNEPITVGRSDKDGICILDKSDLISKNPAVVVVSTHDDQNFLVLNKPLNKAHIIQKDQLKNQYKAWIYLQSEIIRPGSKAKMLIVLKDKNYQSAKDLPVQIRIFAPDFQTIYKQAHQCDNIGTITFILEIPKTYKTGGYTVEVKLGDKVLGSKVFHVESFLPQRIQNRIILKKTNFFKDEPIVGKVQSSYLFGAPAADLNVEATLNAVSKAYKNDTYPEYSFTNLLLEHENKTSYIDQRLDFKLSDKGESNFYFSTKTNQKIPSILQGQIGIHTFDEGKEIATYKPVTIYPYAQMVGLHITTPTLDKGDTLTANTVLLDPKTGKTYARTLQAILKKEIWHYFYDTRGYYKWEKESQEIDRFEVPAGSMITKKIEASGDYILEVHDLLTQHSASQRFTVRGYDYNNIGPTDEINKVEILTDDLVYQKGDTLHAQFKSSIIKGRLLVTLEQDKVYYHKVIAIDQGNAALDIPIHFDLHEGFYLTACIVRDSATSAKLIPFRAWGKKFIKADRSAHHINLSIQTPSVVHSHEMVTVSVNCEKNATLLVSLVDNGILQIIDQKEPHPFTFFNLKPAQKVAYYDLYDLVMHYQTKGKLLAFGSGDEMMMKMAQKHLAPKNAAKRIKPFMYWSGLIQTDGEGFATVDIPVGQFNGKATIVAIALDDKSIGATAAPLVVRDDIIIKADYPRFILAGDKLSIPITIFNTTKKASQVSLTAQISPHISYRGLPQTLTIPPKSSKRFEALLETETVGKGELNITATQNGQTFLHTVELPIYSANTLQTKVFRGESDQKTILKIPKAYFSKEGTKVKITLSTTYLAQLRGTLDDLVNYPYGCSEQSASKLLALLYLKNFIKNDYTLYSRNLLHDREMFIKEGITKLLNLQLENGDFAYWKPYGEVNPYASLYASDILLSLHKEGFKVPQETLQKIDQALTQITQEGRSYQHTKYTNFDRLYAAYLLSQQNKLSDTDINMLYDNNFYDENNIVSLYMMATILKQSNLSLPLQKIENSIKTFDYTQLSNQHQLSGTFYTKTRDIAFALYLHLQLFGKDEQASNLLEKVVDGFDKLYTTQEKAFVLRAVATYYKNQQPTSIDAKVTYNQKTKEINKETTIFDTLDDDTITINPQGKMTRYQVEASGYLPLQLPTQKRNNPLSIQTSFVDAQNKPINLNQLSLGDKLFAKISITNTDKLDNIAIVQRIPSCFTINNERISSQPRPLKVQDSKNFHPAYQDIRDDRVLTFTNLPEQTRIYDKKRKNYHIQPTTTIFYTPLRVTSKGTCLLPPTYAEAMYDSRIKAYAKMRDTIEVK